MSTRCFLAALALVAAASRNAPADPAAIPASPRAGERDVIEVEPVKAITAVHVDNRLGDVRIEGYDGKVVVITAVKEAVDRDTLERLKVRLVPNPDGPVHVSTVLAAGDDARPIPGGSIKIDLLIRAPRSAQVEARVWNGRVMIIGMENGAEINANQGAIDVQNMSGTIVTHLAAGKQEFVEIFGTVDAQAIAGDMALDMVRGQRLDAQVHEGNIDGRQVRVHQVRMRATRGDIRLRGQAQAGGTYHLATYRGTIEVELNRGAPLSVRALARAGQVDMPAGTQVRADERGGITAALSGDGAQPALIEMRSRMGNIRLVIID